MSKQIKTPSFPESVADGKVATWYKKVGEPVARDELIVDIETDKVVLEVVATDDGCIQEIIKQEGDTVLSEEVLAIFAVGAVADKTDEPVAAETNSDATSTNETQEALLSPAARKLVEENNLEIASIAATGKDGRITKEDVLNHLQSKPAAPVASAPAPAAATAAPAAIKIDTGEKVEKRVIHFFH